MPHLCPNLEAGTIWATVKVQVNSQWLSNITNYILHICFGRYLLPGPSPTGVVRVEGILAGPVQPLWWHAGLEVWTCCAREGFDLEPSARRRASPREAATQNTDVPVHTCFIYTNDSLWKLQTTFECWLHTDYPVMASRLKTVGGADQRDIDIWRRAKVKSVRHYNRVKQLLFHW